MKLHSGNKFKAIGMMSGTSLDGMDLAAVEFQFTGGKWNFSIYATETLAYNETWLQKLENSPLLSGEKLIELHIEYGRFIGNQINNFIKKSGFSPDIISSHGHTVFHQPEKHFTFQIGNGADIAATTGITTVSDFRTGDVALGGQGAPLVPVGDRLLFSEYEYCLNLGGFANISFEKDKQIIAFDICPANIILNYFALKKGKPFDKNGELGRPGKVNTELLTKLNNISFYKNNSPKSLGREWIEEIFLPVINSSEISETDKLRTAYEHIAQQIGHSAQHGKMLVSGGGAFNIFLIERIQHFTNAEIIVPPAEIVNFKEALVFAFLGVLRITDQVNCLSSVTGARKDSCSGVIFPA